MTATFTVVTPCRNAAAYIGDTVQSVICQTAVASGRAKLRYVVVDGDSSDGTPHVASNVGSDSVHVISEPDEGMYDALAKGLGRFGEPSDVTCYVNAGDMFAPTAFDVVLDVFEDNAISWLTGYHTYYNRRGQPIAFRLPFRYRRRFLRNGLHGTRLPAVQQEATFWRSSLNRLLDLDVLKTYRLAGDFYMWQRFATEHELYIVSSFLGGFRYHGGHLSDNMNAYRDEMRRTARDPHAWERLLAGFDKILWRSPDRMKKMANQSHLLRYDRSLERWR